MRKNLKNKVGIFATIILLFIYGISYVFLRAAHDFVHICYYYNGEKYYDDVRMYNIYVHPDDVWFQTILVTINTIYTPLMSLETYLHSYDLLPTSCPWAEVNTKN